MSSLYYTAENYLPLIVCLGSSVNIESKVMTYLIRKALHIPKLWNPRRCQWFAQHDKNFFDNQCKQKIINRKLQLTIFYKQVSDKILTKRPFNKEKSFQWRKSWPLDSAGSTRKVDKRFGICQFSLNRIIVRGYRTFLLRLLFMFFKNMAIHRFWFRTTYEITWRTN